MAYLKKKKRENTEIANEEPIKTFDIYQVKWLVGVLLEWEMVKE